MGPLLRARDWTRAWWPAVLLGVATIGAYGAVYYSFGVLIEPVRAETGWATSQLAGAFSLSVLVGGAGGVVAGRVLDRTDGRLVLLAALGVGCALLFAASWATEAWQFMVAWTLGGGAVAGGLYYHVTMALTARLYPDRRAAAFSVLTLLGALAGPVFYPLAGWLVEALAWRDALRVLTAALAVLVLPAALLVRAPAPRRARDVAVEAAAPSVLRQLREPRVLLLLAMIACVSLSTSAVTLHQVAAMQATGLSLAAASSIAGTRGLFQFAGRVCLSPLVRRLGIAGAIALCYALASVGAVMLGMAGPVFLVIGFISLSGVAVGLLSPLHGLFATEVYGETDLGSLMGVQQVVASISGAIGPWAAGLAVDGTGAYTLVLASAAGLYALGVCLIAAQRRVPLR